MQKSHKYSVYPLEFSSYQQWEASLDTFRRHMEQKLQSEAFKKLNSFALAVD